MKITHNQASYILDYKKPHRFAKYCGIWSIEPVSEADGYSISCDVKWWIYSLMIVPVTIIEAMWSMWDGGLKYYRPSNRNLAHYVFFPPNDARYDRIVEIIKILQIDGKIR